MEAFLARLALLFRSHYVTVVYDPHHRTELHSSTPVWEDIVRPWFVYNEKHAFLDCIKKLRERQQYLRERKLLKKLPPVFFIIDTKENVHIKN
jgi:hypothetical protein